MRHQEHPLFKLLITLALALCASIGAFLFIGWPHVTPNLEYGMTFSRPYAQELGLDPDVVLKTALDDVKIRRFRLAAYWKQVEPLRNTWDFTDLDYQISEIGKRNGKVVLAIGEKLPRWPECWGPDWWKSMSRAEQRVETLKYIEAIVLRYKDNPAIDAWQIENEPHFAYGNCPSPDYFFIPYETNFVRGLDSSHKIVTTDSGELSSWLTLAPFVDQLGISVYRTVRNPMFGTTNIHYWFVPPYLYQRKSMLLRLFGVKQIYVSEFQMEPWSNKPLLETSIKDQLSSMNITQMKANFSFAERMEIPNIDFWGIEWWIWMKQHGHPEFLDMATQEFGKHSVK